MVASPWRRKFLGYTVTVERKARLKPAPESVKRAKGRIRNITGRRARGRNIRKVIKELNCYLRGWSPPPTRSILERTNWFLNSPTPSFAPILCRSQSHQAYLRNIGEQKQSAQQYPDKRQDRTKNFFYTHVSDRSQNIEGDSYWWRNNCYLKIYSYNDCEMYRVNTHAIKYRNEYRQSHKHHWYRFQRYTKNQNKNIYIH